MSAVTGRAEGAPGAGIQPVPQAQRTLNAFDLAVLWGDLGIGLLVLVTGALLVPGLGFAAAMGAIVLGSVIGSALLALTGVAGADHGVPTMVLFRSVLGVRGSWAPSFLNAMQMVGWTAVELWAMSYVADLVTRRIFGFSARPLWLGITAVLCTGLALWGPVGVIRVWMERFGTWMILLICGAMTLLVLGSTGIGAALSAKGTGGWPAFGSAVDLVIAMPISWLPLIADYNRFAKGPRSAFLGTFSGYLFANVWLYALGALLVLTAGASPSPGAIAGGILALAGGSLAGLLFLVGLLVGESDEAFANIYSGAVTLQNIWPRVAHRALVLIVAGLGTALAAWLTMERYESFLFLLGSVFVPLFGILAAEYFVMRRRTLDVDQLYRRDGQYWFSDGVRWRAFVPWILGFFVYHWFTPTGPGWWIEAVRSLAGAPLTERFTYLGASIPSFVAAFLIALALPRLSSKT
ncbi:MAG: cytosine permease [Actinomycetota bacterium]|nr:cytosine permease [Actinomycetota bacterium]